MYRNLAVTLSFVLWVFAYLAYACDLPSKPFCIANAIVGDFDKDGKPDFVVIGNRSYTIPRSGPVYIILSSGNNPVRLADNAIGLAMGDFDGDNNLDLVIISQETPGPRNRAAILLGNGDGTFKELIPFPSSFTNISVADFNGDGLDDLIVSTQNLSIDIYLSNGDGTFEVFDVSIKII